MASAAEGVNRVNADNNKMSPNGSTNPPAHATLGHNGVGVHVGGVPNNTDLNRLIEEDFIVDPVDREIVKQQHSSFPVDQICRYIPTSHKNSMRYEHYSIDERNLHSTVTEAFTESTSGMKDIKVENAKMFEPNDTIFVKNVRCKAAPSSGTDLGDEPLRLFVHAVDRANNKLTVLAINGAVDSSDENATIVPDIAADSDIYRMAPAFSEGDMQGNIISSHPTKRTNYMQIFKTQIAETSIQRDSTTEVPFTMDDQAEIAIRDLRKHIEVSFIFGAQGYRYDDVAQKWIYTCGGIIQQMMDKGTLIPYDPEALAMKDPDTTHPEVGETYLIKNMVRQIFMGNSGSPRRFVFAGSDFVANIATIPGVYKQMEAKSIERRYGVDWKVLNFMTWTLNLYQHPLLDEFDMAGCAIVLDLVYVNKAVFRSLTETILKLQEAGVFDGHSVVWTEISSICLKYPETHGMFYLESEFNPRITDSGSSSSSSSAAA